MLTTRIADILPIAYVISTPIFFQLLLFLFVCLFLQKIQCQWGIKENLQMISEKTI